MGHPVASASVYLSSTHEDLREYRLRVYEALRKAGYLVRAMEDYIACEQRPLHQCLADVERSSIYVGIFAFRYGYVPPQEDGNPEGRSITELEYERAGVGQKPRLAFLASDEMPWPQRFADSYTGENEAGAQIRRLRADLQRRHVVSSFTTPDQLAGLVLAAIAKHTANATPQQLVNPISWNIARQGSPYPGLLRFTRNHRSVFFGREADVEEVLHRLSEPGGRFLLIHGDSGVGKSSLIDAGVLPRLEEAAPGDHDFRTVRMVPSNGTDPFDALGRALQALGDEVGVQTFSARERWIQQPGDLASDLCTIASGHSASSGLVIFIDQMEELFAEASAASSRQMLETFLSELTAASIRCQSLRIVGALRGDFLHHCHQFESLRLLLNGRGHYAVGRPASHHLRDMILGPARCAGLQISSRLVDRLVHDTGHEAGNLPLLAFVLQRLYGLRQANELTEAAYDTIGGVDGAIAEHVRNVEGELAKSSTAAAASSFEQLFPLLVQVNAEGMATRLRTPLSSFKTHHRAMVELLVDKRLLVAERKGQESDTEDRVMVSVAHERLFAAWPALTTWIDRNRAYLRFLRNAENEAVEWSLRGRPPTYLWSVEKLKHLDEALELLPDVPVSPTLREFAEPDRILLAELAHLHLSFDERARLVARLASVRDRRPGVALTSEGHPDIDWIQVPGGVTRDFPEDLQLPAFRIARYPVTNVQFESFLEATDGWRSDRWWQGLHRPESPDVPEWQEDNCPRTNVSWHEAVAFGRWLTARIHLRDDGPQVVRLLMGWEWQHAACSGDTELVYPWRGSLNNACCNYVGSRLQRTSAVGAFPGGTTSLGIADMAGNVWEWCFDDPGPRGRRPQVPAEPSDEPRVIRGGGWSNDLDAMRLSAASSARAGLRNNSLGFRVCLAYPPEHPPPGTFHPGL